MVKCEIVPQLKNQSTWRLLFLSLITLGIYTSYYMRWQTKIINQHLDIESQISEGFVNFILIFAYVTALIVIPYILVEEGHPIESISDYMDTVWGILVLFWAFKARNRMNMLLGLTKDKPQWFHGLWTFLFQTFYFNYKINTLNENMGEIEPELITVNNTEPGA